MNQETGNSSASVDTSPDSHSESELTTVTETPYELSEDILKSDSASSNTDNNLNLSAENSDSDRNDHKRQKPPPPDMTSPYWYNEQCFARYWKHYHKVMNWYQKHLQTSRNIQGQYYRNFFPSHPGPGGSNTNSAKTKKHHRHSRKKRARKQKTARKLRLDLSEFSSKTDPKPNLEKSDEPMSGTEGSGTENQRLEKEEFEMEITDEMLEFFAKSQQHKKERDAKDRESNVSKSDVLVNIEDAHKPVRTVEPPKERPGVRRTAEMKLLYGKGAAMVHGMETALKMTYDRNLDVKQPKIWPNIPIRIVFAD